MSRGPCAPDLPAAVLWDVDGTLVDTEPYWIAEEHALVESYGGQWSHEQAMLLVGQSLPWSGEYLARHTPVTLPPEQVVARLVAGVGRRLAHTVPWRPGAFELLGQLHALGVPSAAVTMSYRALTDLLQRAIPAGWLDVVVAGDEIAHGKPHPEPYATAADRLGVRPGACVAIEDSEPGARSAVAAGVPTIVVPHVTPVPVIAGAVQLATLLGVQAHDLGRLAAGADPRTRRPRPDGGR